MSAANPLISSVNSGEFSPRMESRVDFDRYPNAAKMLRNCVLFPQGGFTRRPGTRHVAEVKTSADETIIIPFQYSEADSYTIEAGDFYMRFYRRQGRVDVDDTDAVITNGTFTSNINDWDDRSTVGAFPTVEGQNGGYSDNTNTGVAPLPSGIQVGELLILMATFHATGARTVTTPAGWTLLYSVVGGNNLRRAVGYYRVATGAEGSSVNIVGSGAGYWAMQSLRCSGYTGTPEAATATGSSATPDPPSLTPSWGSTTTMWLVVDHAINCNSVTLPTGFSQSWNVASSGAYAFLNHARLPQELATKDPDPYGSVSTNWIAATIALQPNPVSILHDPANGRLQLPGAEGGESCAEQDVAVGAGNKDNEHVLKFRVEGYGLGTVGLQIGSASEGSDILSRIECGIGEHSIGFTPGVTTFYVQFCNSTTPAQTMWIDNVSFIDDAPMEVVSPFATAELAELKTFQSANVVYLLHPNYYPRRLERRGHRSWSIIEAFFEDGPYLAVNDGTDINATQLFDNPIFLDGLAHWTDSSAGDAYVEHNDDSDIVELDPGTSAGGGNAVLRTSARVTPGLQCVVRVLIVGVGPVTVKIGTIAGDGTYVSTTLNAGWTSFDFPLVGADLHVRFEYNEWLQNRAAVGACIAYDETARLLQPNGTEGEVVVTAYGFTPFAATDVGRLLRFGWPGSEPGYGVVIGYTSTTEVTILVLRTLGDDSPTEDWQFGAWGGEQGYPTVMGFFDGRSVIANTEILPQTMWASQSGYPQDMRPDSFVSGGTTVEDDDAINKTFDSAQINPILWINGQRQLVVGTVGGQWVVSSSGPVITPADTSAKQHSAVPAGSVQHAPINQITIFADRSKREVHDIGYKYEDNGFVATDLTILADHIFRSRIAQMVYQRRPYSSVWARRADGRLAAMSYNRQHEVLGWSQSIIGGSFGSGAAVVKSIAVIPGAEDSGQQYNSDERDEVWMIVKRTINGNTVQYVEFMEYFFDGVLREDYDTEAEWRAAMVVAQADAFYVDSGLTYDGAATTTITGLDHLEGETVKVLADGKVISDKTVSGGQITLPTAASKVHVGLAYKFRYESLKMAVGARAGTAVNKVKIITSVGLVLLDTGEFKVTTVEYDETSGRRQFDLYDIGFRRDRDASSDTVPLFTGEVSQSTEGAYSGDPRIYCEGDAPVPFTLIGLAPMIETVNTAPARK